ncbi:hypothetical protein GGF31_000589 [Allomyces arbusculus]|nr:hypothetical protein GGF31_000589 [Allomyces arbusculus]
MDAAAPPAWDPLTVLAGVDATTDPETAEVVHLMQVKHRRRLAEIAQMAVSRHRRAIDASLVQSSAAMESAVDRIAQDQHAWTAHAREAAARVAAVRDEARQRGDGLATAVASLLAQLDDQAAQSAKARDDMVAAVHRRGTLRWSHLNLLSGAVSPTRRSAAVRTKDAHAQLARELTEHDRTTHDRLAEHLASVPDINAVLAAPAGGKLKTPPPPPQAAGGDPMQGVERT